MSDTYSTYPNQNLELKYCLRMTFSHVNVGSAQRTLHRAEGVKTLPTTIKSHVVKIVITWSISRDEILAYPPKIFPFCTITFKKKLKWPSKRSNLVVIPQISTNLQNNFQVIQVLRNFQTYISSGQIFSLKFWILIILGFSENEYFWGYELGPSINRPVIDRTTKLCCQGFV